MLEPNGWKNSSELEVVRWDPDGKIEGVRSQYWIRGYNGAGQVYESGFTRYNLAETRDHAKDLARRAGNGCVIRKKIATSETPHVSPRIEMDERRAVAPRRTGYEEQRLKDKYKK